MIILFKQFYAFFIPVETGFCFYVEKSFLHIDVTL